MDRGEILRERGERWKKKSPHQHSSASLWEQQEWRKAGRIEGDNKWGDAGGEQRCNGGGEGRAGL